jgi:hypothetical protein
VPPFASVRVPRWVRNVMNRPSGDHETDPGITTSFSRRFASRLTGVSVPP